MERMKSLNGDPNAVRAPSTTQPAMAPLDARIASAGASTGAARFVPPDPAGQLRRQPVRRPSLRRVGRRSGGARIQGLRPHLLPAQSYVEHWIGIFGPPSGV